MSENKNTTGKSDTTIRASLSDATEDALEKLRLINNEVAKFDPALKEQAIALLLKREFSTTAPVFAPSAKAVVNEEASVAPAVEFAGLVERWVPSNDNEWTLLAAYYLTKGKTDAVVTGQEINSVLKHHGKGVSNVTKCVDRLARADPALMLQVRKEGTSRQARKVYKVTYSGASFVDERLKPIGGS